MTEALGPRQEARRSSVPQRFFRLPHACSPGQGAARSKASNTLERRRTVKNQPTRIYGVRYYLIGYSKTDGNQQAEVAIPPGQMAAVKQLLSLYRP